jgi:predicted ATPase
LHRGGTLVAMGKAEEGLIEMMEAEAALRATGTSWRFTLRLAEAHVALGRPVPIEDLRAEVAWLATSPSPWSTASNYWRVGRLLLMLPEADEAEAEACFHRAIEVARDQEAKTWELRAARDLARLWAGQGRRAEARDLLAPVHAWFTEGFDLPDLIEAKALLDELG